MERRHWTSEGAEKDIMWHKIQKRGLVNGSALTRANNFPETRASVNCVVFALRDVI
jgi:hypothetical protein